MSNIKYEDDNTTFNTELNVSDYNLPDNIKVKIGNKYYFNGTDITDVQENINSIDDFNNYINNKKSDVNNVINDLLNNTNDNNIEENEEDNMNAEDKKKELEDILGIDSENETILEETDTEVDSDTDDKNEDEYNTSEEETVKEDTEISSAELEEEKTKGFFIEPKPVLQEKVNFVDLDNLDDILIVKAPTSSIDKLKNDKKLFLNKSAYSVYALQSGYRADMTALNLSEITALKNDSVPFIQRRENLYKLVYDHIQAMSTKKPDYELWKRSTSLSDLNTLLYGIYSKTYVEKSKFTITCPNCGKATDIEIMNNSMLQFTNFEDVAKVVERLENGDNPDEVIKNAVINKRNRFQLKNSKIIMEVQIPSLNSFIEAFKDLTPDDINKKGEIYTLKMYVSKVYIPNIIGFEHTNKPSFYAVTDRKEIIKLVSKLTPEDGEQLSDELNKIDSKYRISYIIKNAKCGMCTKDVGEIEVDIEKLLFMKARAI